MSEIELLANAMTATNIALLIIRFGVNSGIAYCFLKRFLEEKKTGQLVYILWVLGITLLQTLTYFLFSFISPSPSKSALNIFADIFGIFLVIAAAFKGNVWKKGFAALCIGSGMQLVVSIIHIVDSYLLLPLSDVIMLNIYRWNEGFYDSCEDALFFCLNFVISYITLTIYCLLFYFYLRLIQKAFQNKDRNFSVYDGVLLMLPFISSLCISVALKMMTGYNLYVDESIFTRVPDTRLWVVISDFLLLSVNVAYIRVFQRMWDYNEEKEKSRLLVSQVEQKEKEIGEIKEIYSDIKGLRHDMKNHLSNISLYIERKYGEDGELKNYLGQMTSAVSRFDISVQTGSGVTDVIISQKAAQAEKKQIIFDWDFVFPKNSSIDAYHIGIILSNALENAIEACRLLPEADRRIYLCSYEKGNLFFIKCENSFDGNIKINKFTRLPETSKENKSAHGIGLLNIKRCAQKYKGDIDIAAENKSFVLTVMLHK